MIFWWRDCFAREVGRNKTPNERDSILDMFRVMRSTDLEGRVIANRTLFVEKGILGTGLQIDLGS